MAQSTGQTHSTPKATETRMPALVAWPLAAAFFGFVFWGVYALSQRPMFGCDNGAEYFVFPSGEYRGGAAAGGSLVAAAVIGLVLWLAGSFAVWRFRRRETLVLVSFSFVIVYLLALVVLGTVVAPLIWGPRVCV